MVAKTMLVKNIAWSQEVNTRDPDFFKKMVQGQNPDVLWIGCSDSRVPAESITNSHPGELFVHRNIANIIDLHDINSGSVIEYAVKVLKVEHIIVCGHYQCGGVRASLLPQSDDIPIVNKHIKGLRDLVALHNDELMAITTLERRVDRLAELNVLNQISTLMKINSIKNSNHPLTLHGWIFCLDDGLINVLETEEIYF